MLYVSTRGEAQKKCFSEILLEGLAADGGLYVPESYPTADLAGWRKLSYPDLSFQILKTFMDDVADLRRQIVRIAGAYAQRKESSRVSQERQVNDGIRLRITGPPRHVGNDADNFDGEPIGGKLRALTR